MFGGRRIYWHIVSLGFVAFLSLSGSLGEDLRVQGCLLPAYLPTLFPCFRNQLSGFRTRTGMEVINPLACLVLSIEGLLRSPFSAFGEADDPSTALTRNVRVPPGPLPCRTNGTTTTSPSAPASRSPSAAPACSLRDLLEGYTSRARTQNRVFEPHRGGRYRSGLCRTTVKWKRPSMK
jgi:hypothetical protein